MIQLHQLFDAWNAFFHHPVSLFPLAIFRTGYGVIIFFNALLTFRMVERHLGMEAIFGASHFYKKSEYRLNLLNLLPRSNSAVYALLVGSALSGLLLSIGLFTRAAAIVSFLTLVSIHHRNSAIFHGGDTVLRIFGFLLMFSDSGAGWSLDSIIGNRPWEAVASPWVLRLMQIQVAIIYLRNVYWKLGGKYWRNGTAVWYPVNCPEFVRYRPPGFLLRQPFLAVATWGTLLLEFSLGSAIWIEEFRRPLLYFGVIFHLMIDLIINVQLFSLTMIVCLLLFW